jgi:hypothetical protein
MKTKFDGMWQAKAVRKSMSAYTQNNSDCYNGTLQP